MVCSVVGLIGLIAIILLIVWHNYHKPGKRSHKHQPCVLQQKSNNENEETFSRYRNKLYERDKGSGSTRSRENIKRSSTELIEIDIDLEKYEKSPYRRLPGDSNNDAKQNTPPKKMPNKKDINIEISRTMGSDRVV